MKPRIRIFSTGIALMLALMVSGCIPGESPTPTVPTDATVPRASWQEIYTGIDFSGPSLGLISGWHGTILRTQDGGKTWSEAKVPVLADLNSLAMLDTDNALAVGSSGNLLRSGDGGQTWTKVESPTAETLNAVAPVSRGGAIAVGWHGTIIGTVDNGKTWTIRLSSSEPALNFESVACMPDGTCMAVSSSGRVFKTTDTFNWAPLSLPNSDQKLFAIDLYDDLTALTAGNIEESLAFQFGGKTVLLKTEDGGKIWGYGPRSFNIDPLSLRFLDKRNALTAGWQGLILRTDDGGSNWIPVVSPTTRAIRAMTVASPNVIFGVGDGQTIIVSRDNGFTWEKLRGN